MWAKINWLQPDGRVEKRGTDKGTLQLYIVDVGLVLVLCLSVPSLTVVLRVLENIFSV